MIEIKCINDIDYEKYDEVWAIVRLMKNKSKKIKQVIELAPSSDLFTFFRKSKKIGLWNERTFQNEYVPKFLEDICKNQNSKDKLNELYNLDRKGKNICLVCFCPDETMCHRSIVAGLLQGAGCNVKLPSNADYSFYYKQYKRIEKSIEDKLSFKKDSSSFCLDKYLKWLKDNISENKQCDNCFEITVPFLDRHNDWLQVYVTITDDNIKISDGGYIIDDKANCLKENFFKIVNCYNVKIVDKELCIVATKDTFPQSLNSLIQCMIVISNCD